MRAFLSVANCFCIGSIFLVAASASRLRTASDRGERRARQGRFVSLPSHLQKDPKGASDGAVAATKVPEASAAVKSRIPVTGAPSNVVARVGEAGSEAAEAGRQSEMEAAGDSTFVLYGVGGLVVTVVLCGAAGMGSSRQQVDETTLVVQRARERLDRRHESDSLEDQDSMPSETRMPFNSVFKATPLIDDFEAAPSTSRSTSAPSTSRTQAADALSQSSSSMDSGVSQELDSTTSSVLPSTSDVEGAHDWLVAARGLESSTVTCQ